MLATECSACGVEYLPPRVYCERCFADLSGSWHAVKPEGVVESFTVLRRGLDGAVLDPPEVRAVVRMGKGQGALIHRLLIPPGRVRVGAAVKPKLKPRAARKGNILDIEGFVRR
ncbi:MAG TPA: Zn-ribbon domain-containing OB-fold protein [Candidatus Thermoplasmatota archaeon]